MPILTCTDAGLIVPKPQLFQVSFSSRIRHTGDVYQTALLKLPMPMLTIEPAMLHAPTPPTPADT